MSQPVAAGFADFDPYSTPSPCFVLDLERLEKNAEVTAETARAGGGAALLALKAFAAPAAAPVVMRHLEGVCASGLHEARLGRKHFGGAIHSHGAAFPAADLDELLALSDHVAFNSVPQLRRARAAIARGGAVEIGLRLNVEQREVEKAIYDPSSPRSRLGVTKKALERDADEAALEALTGVHVHNLCGHGLAPLERSIDALERGFPDLLARASWVNLGGGHYVSAPDYDRAGLARTLRAFGERWAVRTYIEPGEAIALGGAVLVTEVLDIAWNDGPIAILDCSPTAHFPDAIEGPYKVDILGARDPHDAAHVYRMGGLTCLAGDILGDYGFERPLKVGDRLMIDDMAFYTMVKTTTFNGVGLPAIAAYQPSTGALEIIARFGQEEIERRLG